MIPEPQNLYLDPAIRDWVLFPITIVMILVGLLRHYVTMLLNSAPKKQPKANVREQRILLRSSLLRSSAALCPLPSTTYLSLSTTLQTSLTSGTYLKPLESKPEGPDQDMPVNPLDPSQMEGMMDGLKKQAVMMVPNMVIMQWIQIFFSGFVLIKLPFPLTYGFKFMLQRDINTPNLDVRYVSALSWYFLNLFGLNAVFKLMLGQENAPDGARDMSAVNMLAGAGGPTMAPGQKDLSKLHKAEAENLAFAEGLYKYAGEGVEERVLRLYGKKVGGESRKDR